MVARSIRFGEIGEQEAERQRRDQQQFPGCAGARRAGTCAARSSCRRAAAPTRNSAALATIQKMLPRIERGPGVGGGDGAGDDGEDHQAEHVVDDRGAEDDARFPGLQPVEVGEHAGGDADAGGAQRGADEDVGEPRLAGAAPGPRPTSRGRTARRRRRRRRRRLDRPTDSMSRDVRLEPDLEQQQDDADLRQDADPDVGAEELEPRVAEQRQVAEDDADDQLAEHRRLMDALGDRAADLGADQDDHQADEHRCHRIAVIGRGRPLPARRRCRWAAEGVAPGSGRLAAGPRRGAGAVWCCARDGVPSATAASSRIPIQAFFMRSPPSRAKTRPILPSAFANARSGGARCDRAARLHSPFVNEPWSRRADLLRASPPYRALRERLGQATRLPLPAAGLDRVAGRGGPRPATARRRSARGRRARLGRSGAAGARRRPGRPTSRRPR